MTKDEAIVILSDTLQGLEHQQIVTNELMENLTNVYFYLKEIKEPLENSNFFNIMMDKIKEDMEAVKQHQEDIENRKD